MLVSFTALFLVAGCGPAVDTPQPKSEPGANAVHHADHGAGPHGGTLTDWGGGTYHVEFTVNHDKQEATVYILGSDEKSPAPIKADALLLSIDEPPFQVKLTAQPLEREAQGTSTRFVGQHENLGIVQEFSGTISGQVEGTPYAGDFHEEAHSADHDHAAPQTNGT
jgi:hypothetical protein